MKKSLLIQIILLLSLFISPLSAQDSSLVGFWTFDDSTGQDSSVYANNAGIYPNPVFIEGMKGSALYFDGIDDNIFIWDSNSLDTDSSMTISLCIMPDSVTPGGAKVMSKWYSSPSQGDWLFSLSSQDSCGGTCVSYGFGFANYGVYGSVNGWFSIGPPHVDYFLTLGEWNFITVTFDTGLVNLYYNGNLIKTDTSIIKYTSLNEYGTDDIYVGRLWNGYAGYNFNGGLDEIRIYNRALSTNEISDIYNQVTSVKNSSDRFKLPTKFELLQNYPNPFNPTTTIKYALPKAAHVKLEIFTITGKKIKVLVDENKHAGYHTMLFNAGDLSSGVYFYKITTNSGYASSKKFILLK